MLSDSFPIKEDGVCLVVEGRYLQDQDADEDAPVLNVVDVHGLVETTYDKKSYAVQFKDYAQRLAAMVPADERTAWQEQMTEWARKVLADFDSYACFTGGSMDPKRWLS